LTQCWMAQTLVAEFPGRVSMTQPTPESQLGV
jgi:hypothetical protein